MSIEIDNFFNAVETRDLAKVKELLLVNPKLVVSRNCLDRTALMLSAVDGCKKIFKFLISMGSDVEIKDKYGSTPLHFVARKIYLDPKIGKILCDMAKTLIDNGAKVNIRDREYKIPLHYAAMFGSSELINFLIENGSEVNIKDRVKNTPLHYAAMQGSGIEGFSGIRNKDYSKALELLIFNGADIISEGRFKKTALMLAMERNNKDIVDLLRKHGAKE